MTTPKSTRSAARWNAPKPPASSPTTSRRSSTEAFARPRRIAAHPREPPVRDQATCPREIKERDRVTGYGQPVVDSYHRVTFDPKYVRVAGNNHLATLLHPGHPLMAATMERHRRPAPRRTDAEAAILVDRADVSTSPYVVCLLEHDVDDGRTGRDGQPHVISRRVQFVRIDPDGTISAARGAPYPEPRRRDRRRTAAAATVLRRAMGSGSGPRRAASSSHAINDCRPRPRRGGHATDHRPGRQDRAPRSRAPQPRDQLLGPARASNSASRSGRQEDRGCPPRRRANGRGSRPPPRPPRSTELDKERDVAARPPG